LSEAAAEALHTGDTNVIHLTTIGIQKGHACLSQEPHDQFLLTGLDVVIPQDAKRWHARGQEMLGEHLSFGLQSVVCEIPAEEQ
jgi:hypothetical protein